MSDRGLESHSDYRAWSRDFQSCALRLQLVNLVGISGNDPPLPGPDLRVSPERFTWPGGLSMTPAREQDGPAPSFAGVKIGHTFDPAETERKVVQILIPLGNCRNISYARES
jgi:hypothetical protein